MARRPPPAESRRESLLRALAGAGGRPVSAGDLLQRARLHPGERSAVEQVVAVEVYAHLVFARVFLDTARVGCGDDDSIEITREWVGAGAQLGLELFDQVERAFFITMNAGNNQSAARRNKQALGRESPL